MSDTRLQSLPTTNEHVDVLIIGAGISGIGAAYHLRQQFPNRSFKILEALEGFGGTWWTHRYPGARSDSDLHTYGYRFKPWPGRSIATSDEIRNYLNDIISENNLDQHICYQHKVTSASWSSQENRWAVDVTRVDTGETLRLTTNFLWICQGYYNHQKGYTPEWPTLNRYKGIVIHPQHWPEDLDYTGKKIVVIGSGATAATLIPSLAGTAGHVTMLQRSPTFFATQPWEHELAAPLRALKVPEEWTHDILRRAHIAKIEDLAKMSFEQPDELRKLLIDGVRAHLPEDFDVDTHFNPSYRPWQQRVASVPDGDLFAAIRGGQASVVTDSIECFTETGITLSSGKAIEADIIVTATGLELSLFGGVNFSVDGEPVDFTKRVTYRGLMISGVPNMSYMFGYLRFSWTLRVDMVSDFVCRLLAHMDTREATTVVPTLRPEDEDMPLLPWANPENFNAGYFMRAQEMMFRQGDREPWVHMREYYEERDTLPVTSVDDGVLIYD
ncbi:FAD-containing monooxygenase EthA [Paraburkholderia phytofirmans OLGA172]|uniref:FAD-containing monooxygenase EthA n=1 Tax=Paraburkholderia phytofirmans OLGA172 TaxID=1417228 RepID=A0A161HNH3_9BURK|nr:NAD(P)/FAD-dependent oxidoreductase [Paraburkholderia phytofirmans]ANB72097.1 FAD-containing monooxygenase EthA [Paraburkholderia phytofirmans OLGA172]